MPEQTLTEAIRKKLSEHHTGSTRAIKREVLLDYLRVTGFPDITDDEMRKTIDRHLPRVCSSPRGYYVAADGRERDEAAQYHRKKGLGSLDRAKRLVEAYPEFGPEQFKLEYPR